MVENGIYDKTFGDIIIELRTKKNMTQKELGEKLGVSDKTISRWENNGSLPDMDMLRTISKYFKISISDLAIIRTSSEGNSEVAKEIIKEFTRESTKRKRIIKYISISSAIAIVFLIGVIIFTNSYNKFKVYNVVIKSNELSNSKGIYVETRIKDVLHINTLRIRNYNINEKDSVNVDLYYLENNEEKILYSYSSLNNIKFVTHDSYIKIKNLKNYFDNLYIKVTIVDIKNIEHSYTGKLEFILDFSNNKINKHQDNLTGVSDISLSPNEIRDILLKNGFILVTKDLISKENNNRKTNYVMSSNILNYTYNKNDFSYKYSYMVFNNILTVNIINKDNIEIENYTYDVQNDKLIECITGKCNGYQEAMDILNKNVLYLFN